MTRSGTGERPIPFPRRPRHPASDAEDGRAPGAGPQALAEIPNNLPTFLTPFIGRYAEVDAVCSLIADENVRLLTLTGPGGVGKTRTAIRAAEDLLQVFEDGVFFVALAPLTDPQLVLPTIAQALGVKEDGVTTLADQLNGYLRDKGMLLILDNFEQVASGATQVATLLGNAPGVQVIITSRVSLHLYGEYEYAVPPMATPEPGSEAAAQDDIEQIAGYEAIQLFVARAREVRPDFALTSANAGVVAQMCNRLDGLPLALELAAARTRLFSPQALLARLDKSLPLLTGGPADRPDRQQTLRNAIGWSYNLLDRSEQRLFTRLAVFAGGCTLNAVRHVTGDMGLEEGELIDKLEALVDKNLLRQREQADGEPRFWMLATIHEYALEKLIDTGEYERWQGAHADFYVALADEASHYQRGSQQEIWFRRLGREHDNFRAALSFLIPRSLEGARLAATLGWFWYIRGYYSEGRGWFDRTLPQLETEEAGPAQSWHATAFRIAGGMAAVRGDHMEAIELTQKSLDLARKLGDKVMEASALNNLGTHWNQLGNYERGNGYFEESLVVKRELGDMNNIAFALNNFAATYSLRGNYAQAISACRECIEIARAAGDKLNLVVYMDTLGAIYCNSGDLKQATEAFQESLSLSAETSYKMMEAWGLADLGMALLYQGDEAQAEPMLEEGLAEFRSQNDSTGICAVLTTLGRVKTQQHSYAAAQAHFEEAISLLLRTGQRNASAVDTLEWFVVLLAADSSERQDVGEATRATHLCGASEAHRQKLEAPIPPVKRQTHMQSVEALRTQLGTSAFEAAWEEGRALSFEHALALALRRTMDDGRWTMDDSSQAHRRAKSHDASHDSSAGASVAASDLSGTGLTEREVEVLRLVAEGLTNKDIAERLVLSHRTVQAHLYRIFSKLDVTTRSAATRTAIQRRIV